MDEKLQTTLEKRLGESFRQVSERLEQVHKGLGEMQTIANGVGDLKRVLSNVKTRGGVLGEYQLENILEQLLTPDQYSKNVATKGGVARLTLSSQSGYRVKRVMKRYGCLSTQSSRLKTTSCC